MGSSHCDCSEEERDSYFEDVSPDWHDGETIAEKCHTCWGLVKMH